MKDFLLGLLSIGIFAYSIMFIFGMATIISDATYNEYRRKSTCNVTYRYDYVFPVRQVGCWLSERISK